MRLFSLEYHRVHGYPGRSPRSFLFEYEVASDLARLPHRKSNFLTMVVTLAPQVLRLKVRTGGLLSLELEVAVKRVQCVEQQIYWIVPRDASKFSRHGHSLSWSAWRSTYLSAKWLAQYNDCLHMSNVTNIRIDLHVSLTLYLFQGSP